MLQKVVYTRHGKHYYKISRHEPIKDGAVYSYCGGELKLITDDLRFGRLIGSVPADFPDEVDFFNPAQ